MRYGAVNSAPMPEIDAGSDIGTSRPAMDAGPAAREGAERIAKARANSAIGPSDHVSQCLNRHALDDAADGGVDAEIDVRRHGVVAHRVDRHADREKCHRVEAVPRNSLFQGPLPRYDLNSV